MTAAQPFMTNRRLVLGWTWLAVGSLIAAGLMAVMLAASRTPWVQDLIDDPALFKVALVVHVDLSVLIWFFACAGALWTLLLPGRATGWNVAAFAIAVIGTLMVTVAPFVGSPRPLMNNYVPVLRHPWFFVGLVATAAGVAVQAGQFLLATRFRWRPASGERLSLLRPVMGLTALVFLLALCCVALSLSRLPAGVDGEAYYELLFWGGGHVLQFAYTLMLLGAWLVLGNAGAAGSPVAWRRMRALLWLVVLPLVIVPWLYAAPVNSPQHLRGFTELMRWGGLACLPLGILSVWGVLSRRRVVEGADPLGRAAFWSMVLFAAGGGIGFLIRGSNTMIPAHYHGSIVAVTLALMGTFYYMLPHLGLRLRLPSMARWQPLVYASGQLMHIAGLAWSGGHGIQRKVSGAAQNLDGLGEILGMALMGVGGLVSVAGGVMFLLVMMVSLVGAEFRSPQVAGSRSMLSA